MNNSTEDSHRNPSYGNKLVTVSLDDDQSHLLPGIKNEELKYDERNQLMRLVDILDARQDGLIVRRNRNHRIGRLKLRHIIITVPPSMDPNLFVDFYLYASGADLSNFIQKQTVPVDLKRVEKHDIFLVLLAYLFVNSTEQLITRGVAKTYETHTERARLIRGRPIWTKDFGNHPAEGITCNFHVISTDNILNQLILAGLIAAARILNNWPGVLQIQSQIFTWRSIANEIYPTALDFSQAEQRINKLTEQYRSVLKLARAFTLGYSPVSFFQGNSDTFQALEFSLPKLFEQFLERLIRQAGDVLNFEVRSQGRDRTAIIDGNGNLYRQVIPDLIIFRGRSPLAVIDAKYKPNYLTSPRGSRIPQKNRVSNSDIYQLCFYQARLRTIHNLNIPPKAIIVSPQLSFINSIVEQERRTILWETTDQEKDHYGLTLIPLPISRILEAIKQRLSVLDVLAQANELLEFLKAL